MCAAVWTFAGSPSFTSSQSSWDFTTFVTAWVSAADPDLCKQKKGFNSPRETHTKMVQKSGGVDSFSRAWIGIRLKGLARPVPACHNVGRNRCELVSGSVCNQSTGRRPRIRSKNNSAVILYSDQSRTGGLFFLKPGRGISLEHFGQILISS